MGATPHTSKIAPEKTTALSVPFESYTPVYSHSMHRLFKKSSRHKRAMGVEQQRP